MAASGSLRVRKYLHLSCLCLTPGKGHLKEGRESHFEMKVFLILNLWGREASGDSNGGKESSYPEVGGQ